MNFRQGAKLSRIQMRAWVSNAYRRSKCRSQVAATACEYWPETFRSKSPNRVYKIGERAPTVNSVNLLFMTSSSLPAALM
jgi:hypothetical protein